MEKDSFLDIWVQIYDYYKKNESINSIFVHSDEKYKFEIEIIKENGSITLFKVTDIYEPNQNKKKEIE